MSSESESGSGPIAEENGEVEESGRGSRRLAAEAAMRRLGLSGSGSGVMTRSGSKGKEKEKEKEKTPVSVPAITSGTSTPTAEDRTYVPYLAPIVRIPHTTDRSPWSTRGSRLNLRSDLDVDGEMREGVEERLKTLKRVDDTIWGLVEELTRIKSLMDIEAENGVSGED
jgi:E3 ubiquitin-protein ligase synoviolin